MDEAQCLDADLQGPAVGINNCPDCLLMGLDFLFRSSIAAAAITMIRKIISTSNRNILFGLTLSGFSSIFFTTSGLT